MRSPLLRNGLSIEELSREYGLEGTEGMINYLKQSFQYLRENVRGFGDQTVLIQLNSLEFLLDSEKEDLIVYFETVLKGVNDFGSTIEKFFVLVKPEMKIQSQEENQPER